jgi:hypothetical protein
MACLHQPGQRTCAPASNCAAYRRLVSRTVDATTDLHRLAMVIPGTRVIGPDPMVEMLERLYRLSDCGLAMLQVRHLGIRLTVIGATAKIWHYPAARSHLFGLKRACIRAGRRILLVPPSALRRQPRLDCARWVASCAGVRTSRAERDAILHDVRTASIPTLSRAAATLKRQDATSAVLSLVAQGVLAIDLKHPVGPHSRLRQIAIPSLPSKHPLTSSRSPHSSDPVAADTAERNASPGL